MGIDAVSSFVSGVSSIWSSTSYTVMSESGEQSLQMTGKAKEFLTGLGVIDSQGKLSAEAFVFVKEMVANASSPVLNEVQAADVLLELVREKAMTVSSLDKLPSEIKALIPDAVMSKIACIRGAYDSTGSMMESLKKGQPDVSSTAWSNMKCAGGDNPSVSFDSLPAVIPHSMRETLKGINNRYLRINDLMRGLREDPRNASKYY